MFRLMTPRIEILAGAIGPDDFGSRSFGNGKQGASQQVQKEVL